MNGPSPSLGGSEGPPDGDYASYVERLLQRADQQRGAARTGAAPVPHMPAPAGQGDEGRARGKAAARGLPARWPLLLWSLFVLLMWFAPALLPFAIGGLVAAGVGFSLWKARNPPGGKGR